MKKILYSRYDKSKIAALPRVLFEGRIIVVITEKEAEMLFTYMLTGAFAVNKAMGWKKGKDWMRVQRIILNFVSGGMEAVNKLPK